MLEPRSDYQAGRLGACYVHCYQYPSSSGGARLQFNLAGADQLPAVIIVATIAFAYIQILGLILSFQATVRLENATVIFSNLVVFGRCPNQESYPPSPVTR